MKHIVFIHTTPAVIKRLDEGLNAGQADLTVDHIVDSRLSKMLKEDRNRTLERLKTLYELAVDGRTTQDADVVLTCTALSGLAEEVDFPLAVLDSYLHKRAAAYGRILLVATTEGALSPTRKGIINGSQNPYKEVEECFVAGARNALKEGNKDLHDSMVKEAVKRAYEIKQYDAVVLCQPSMAHLKSEIVSVTEADVLAGIDCFIENYV